MKLKNNVIKKSDDGPRSSSDIVFYTRPEGTIIFEVRLKKETRCLSLTEISRLFDRDKHLISRRLRNIYLTEELDRESTVAFLATVQDVYCFLSALTAVFKFIDSSACFQW